jgi:hypothetical protein
MDTLLIKSPKTRLSLFSALSSGLLTMTFENIPSVFGPLLYGERALKFWDKIKNRVELLELLVRTLANLPSQFQSPIKERKVK